MENSILKIKNENIEAKRELDKLRVDLRNAILKVENERMSIKNYVFSDFKWNIGIFSFSAFLFCLTTVVHIHVFRLYASITSPV